MNMDKERPPDEVDGEIAEAFGVFALSDASLPEAATLVGVSRWELEEAIDRAGLADTFDIDVDADVSSTIDDLLGDE
jgi:hypothetical protein